MTDPPESANDGDDPLFRPEDLEQWLGETPQPLVIDVEQIRMCSEQQDLLLSEVLRIVEKTLDYIRAVLPTMPLGRHLRLVTIRGLPGSIAIQTRNTPWGSGAGQIYQGIRSCIAQALTENGVAAERVPDMIASPPAPQDPASVLSIDIVVEDDEESTVVLAPPDTEIDEEADEPPPGSLSFCERSELHIYGTKWKNPPSPPLRPGKYHV